jgi:hypothetical protein
MTYHYGRHGGHEPLRAVISDDGGATWREAAADFPLIEPSPAGRGNALDFSSGIMGTLRDGTTCWIDHDTVEAAQRWKDRSSGPYHEVNQQENPTFQWRRWASNGESFEKFTFKVDGLPFARASYQCYASLLELDDGDFLTALEWASVLPESEWKVEPGGRVRKLVFGTFIVRSPDRGRSWEFVTAFDPREVKPTYGVSDYSVDEGFDEADLTVAADGGILCVMRTGSYSPMYQSRSGDGGRTWSVPQPVGWQGVKPRLRLLPSGVLACAAGRGSYGHPQITHVMLSLDGTGTHREAPFAFHTGPGCSYTSTMLRDGKIHVVYSHSDFTRELGWGKLPSQAIRRAVLDVRVEDL